MEVDTVSDGVLIFGAAESGQLGTGTDDDAVAVPRLLAAPPGVRIVSVALGLCHSLWLTDAGALFAAGLNDVGQCGVGAPSTLAAPQRLESLETRQFVQVAAGDAFSGEMVAQHVRSAVLAAHEITAMRCTAKQGSRRHADLGPWYLSALHPVRFAPWPLCTLAPLGREESKDQKPTSPDL